MSGVYAVDSAIVRRRRHAVYASEGQESGCDVRTWCCEEGVGTRRMLCAVQELTCPTCRAVMTPGRLERMLNDGRAVFHGAGTSDGQA